MPTLHILTEGLTKKSFELQEGVTTIGRDEENAIHVPDASMSNSHGYFTVTGGQVIYQDLGSTNGSFVNDEQVTEAVLIAGTEFRLASVLMMIGNGVVVEDRAKRTTALIKVAPHGIKPEELMTEVTEISSPFKSKQAFGGKLFKIFIIILVVAIGGIVVYSLKDLLLK